MKKFIISISLILFLCLNAFCGTKRALVVVIGDYPIESGWNKIASQNDKAIIIEMLHANGFKAGDITILEESGATLNSITSSLTELASRANKGDQVYVHFSCHGQQITDQDGDESINNPKDKFDEALIPYDAAVAYDWHGYKGDKHLIDDVLNEYFSRIKEKVGQKGTLLVIYDACHSGDIDRDSTSGEYPSFRGTFDAFNQPLKARRETSKQYEVTWASISACKDFQTNFEVSIEGKMYGRLSYAISRCLKCGIGMTSLIEALEKEYEVLPMPNGKHQSLQYINPDTTGKRTLF